MPIGPEEGLIYPDGAWPDATSESMIRKYWRILYKNRWVVLAAVGFCLALALIVSMLTQREYSAATRFRWRARRRRLWTWNRSATSSPARQASSSTKLNMRC